MLQPFSIPPNLLKVINISPLKGGRRECGERRKTPHSLREEEKLL